MKQKKLVGILCLIVAILILGSFWVLPSKKESNKRKQEVAKQKILVDMEKTQKNNFKEEIAIVGDEVASLNSEAGVKARELCDFAISLDNTRASILGVNPESGFNNLSFVYYCLSQTGLINTKISTYEYLYSHALSFSKTESQPGDIIFFQESGEITHVAILLADNTMIHVTDKVTVLDLNQDTYYKEHILGYGRYINFYTNNYSEEDADKYEEEG